jgi:Tetracyclin repressor-like, C-terminal domain
LTAAHEPAAMQRLPGVFTGSLLASVADHLDDDERNLRAGLVASQLIGVAMARYVWRVARPARAGLAVRRAHSVWESTCFPARSRVTEIPA